MYDVKIFTYHIYIYCGKNFDTNMYIKLTMNYEYLIKILHSTVLSLLNDWHFAKLVGRTKQRWFLFSKYLQFLVKIQNGFFQIKCAKLKVWYD